MVDAELRLRPRIRSTVMLVVTVSLLVSCTNANQSPASTNPTSTTQPPPGPTTTTGIPDGETETFTITDATLLVPASGVHLEIISDWVRAAIVNEYEFTEASLAFQQEVFADGEVTQAEYDRAVFAGADCIRALGYNVEGPFRDTGTAIAVGLDPRIHMYYQTINAPPGFDVDGDRCYELWQATITSVWVGVNAPTEAEKQIWLEAAWDCARQQGLPLSDPPTESEATDAAGLGCEPWLALPPR